MSIVYATADLHGHLPEVPGDADALLIAGDICPDFVSSARKARGGVLDKGGHRQSAWLDTEFRGWLMSLTQRGCQIVAIWGNHDFVGEHPELIPQDLPWTLLQDSEATLDLPSGPLRVYGTPWVPELPYWAFYARDEALALCADSIPSGLDVLMSHGPPYGAGDFIDGEYVGDRHLNEALARAQPKVTICGHIHEDVGVHGLSVEGHTAVVYNVAAVDDAYRLYDQPLTKLID